MLLATLISNMALFRISNKAKQIIPRAVIDSRNFHETPCLSSVQSGRYKPTKDRSRPLTYEQANIPSKIAHTKSWNSWNTTTLEGGFRRSETLLDDAFIRKFITGTFHGLLASEVIIKRQHNIIRIGFIALPRINMQKFGFLVGYSEELLSYWFQSPVKLEFQFVDSMKNVIIQYI